MCSALCSCRSFVAVVVQDEEEDSKYAYNSDDDGEAVYGMANEMDI